MASEAVYTVCPRNKPLIDHRDGYLQAFSVDDTTLITCRVGVENGTC